MVCRISLRQLLVAGAGLVSATTWAAAQEMTDPQAMQRAMQLQVPQIVNQRPSEAEAAARAFLQVLSMQAGQGPVEGNLPALDSLKAAAPEVYWNEVAQLTVQSNIVKNLARRDSVRARLATQMFGTEVQARSLQRGYRTATEARRQAMRKQIEALISRHFEVEDQLRALEIADIERRLAEVRADTERRREKRAEFVRWAVDDIIRDATRPQ